MRVLITGVTGFLGKQTALRLASEGAQVTGLGRNVAIGESLEKHGIKFVKTDLAKLSEVERAFSAGADVELAGLQGSQDAVIHCAALSSPWGKYSEFYEANVVGTSNLIDVSIRANVKRFVHVSTPSIYVDGQSRLNIREEEPLPERGINFYAQTKRLAEEAIDHAVTQGLPAITIRPQGIIGPGDSAILPRVIRVAKKGLLPVISAGKLDEQIPDKLSDNLIDLTYVDNVVEALVLSLTAPRTAIGHKYNITNGEPVRLYETLGQILTRLGFSYRKKYISFNKAYWIAAAMEMACRSVVRWKEPILTRYSVCALGLSRTLNIDAARRDLKYVPLVSMEQAIERIVRAYQDQRTE